MKGDMRVLALVVFFLARAPFAQEEQEEDTKWACAMCGPPFGPPSGDMGRFLPPYPWKGPGTVVEGKVEFDCDNVADADEQAACMTMVETYTNPSIEWFQSTDDRSHTIASVVSNVGYPTAVQMSVGTSSSVELTTTYNAATDGWLKVTGSASLCGFAITQFVEFADSNGDYIYNDGDAVKDTYAFGAEAWNVANKTNEVFQEGNEETKIYKVAHASSDAAFTIDYRTSDLEVVENDATMNAERIKADIGITHTRKAANTYIAIEIVIAASKFENGTPSDTMGQFINSEDGFVDWSSLAVDPSALDADGNPTFLRVVTGEFEEVDIASVQAGAFHGLLSGWTGSLVLQKAWVTFVPDATFTAGTQKCDNYEQDPDEAISARACQMNCAADGECQGWSYEYETGCFIGHSSESNQSCANNNAFVSGKRNGLSNNGAAGTDIEIFWDPAVTYEEGGFTPGEEGVDLDYELAVVMVMLVCIGFLSYVTFLVIQWWLKKYYPKDEFESEKFGDKLGVPGGQYGATHDNQI